MMKQKKKSLTLVTEGFLEERLDKLEDKLEEKLKYKLEEFGDGIDENARKYRDEILTKLDGVMGELQTMREENTVGAYQTSEFRDRVDDHEKRTVALEQIKT